MSTLPRLRGPAKYRLKCAAVVARSIAAVSARRVRHGPRLPEWNWTVELGTEILRNQLLAAFALPDVKEQRRYLDSLLLDLEPAHTGLTIKQETSSEVRGTWFRLEGSSPITLLYLHGGGFALYPEESYRSFISTLVAAAHTSAFALDYRLAPEHPFPAALDDARSAYRWLLMQGVSPECLVIAGDSAGGNLTLALLCDLRDRGLPLPALAFVLSPATDFHSVRPSMLANEPFDWLNAEMALTWRDWYCRPEQRSLPQVSPIFADLRGLPPIYIQAGRAEILYDSIAAFAVEAKSQGAWVILETWPGMNHVFQFFGDRASQSAEALGRIGKMITDFVPQAVTS